MNLFNTPLTVLKGVGDKRCEILGHLGIKTIYDLLYFFPIRYEDRRNFIDIDNVQEGNVVSLKATLKTGVRSVRVKGNLVISNAIICDDSGEIMTVWYNQRFVEKQLSQGKEYTFYGKIKKVNGRLALVSPVFEPIDVIKGYTGKLLPVYPLLSKIPQKTFRDIMLNAIEYSRSVLSSFLPECVENKYNILCIEESVNKIHFPKNELEASEARRRFVFEDYFYFQIALLKMRKKDAASGLCFHDVDLANFKTHLPFEMTLAQKKVLGEITADLTSGRQMNRLLQGDVGSGKTVVSAAAVELCAQNGYLSVVIAPTEILVVQHYKNFSQFLPNRNIRLLTSSCSKKERKELINELKMGNVDVLIGTHAVLEDNINLDNLGLVVIDEQHRFGVRQRQKLINKGVNPHLLVMTATPIPRTLSIIMFNDLDISLIDALPQGRKKVKTYLVGENYRQRVYTFLEKEVANGGQAYVVCPLVEESENLNIKDAVGLSQDIKEKIPKLRVAVLHGKMKDQEKNKVMNLFKEHKLDVIVSTTVIEVGVDVKNATLMIIENAERFGLSQLHQLRGRVGRGDKQSYCILIANTSNQETIKRLKVVESSNDGFYISEEDLKLRGPGDFIGTRQHGLPSISLPVGEDEIKLLYNAKQALKDITEEVLIPTDREKQIMQFLAEKMADAENNENILN